jgi:hypothetical protein
MSGCGLKAVTDSSMRAKAEIPPDLHERGILKILAPGLPDQNGQQFVQ